MPNKNNLNIKKTTVIGLMSGTSLDGLDICAVEFIKENGQWSFEFICSETIQYNQDLKSKLENATKLNGLELSLLNIELGNYFGKATKTFIGKHNIVADFISSHGHTVFHQPDKKMTLQIGSGQEIANQTQLPTIFDFRSKDVSLGGHGAPLVPIGDKLLFSTFDACLNFGGIANISFSNQNNERIAFDICPFNMGLNYYANKLGFNYDESGKIAKTGKLNTELLNALNSLNYYKQQPPKSLGIEWFESYFLKLCERAECSTEDKLHTISHHIAFQISDVLKKVQGDNILITGGGVYNSFIVELIQSMSKKKIEIPSHELIDFKEALIFAFLGVLKWNNEVNVLKSVTGASKNTSSGVVVTP